LPIPIFIKKDLENYLSPFGCIDKVARVISVLASSLARKENKNID